VASTDLAIGSNISENQLKIVIWPKESIPAGSFSDPKAVAGNIAIRSISAGEPITESKLLPKKGTPGSGIMTYAVPIGHRAVTVAVNEVAGVAGFINPNSRVDIVLTAIPPGSKEQISKIILQDIPILAIGQIMEQKEGKPVLVTTVTLDLTPEDSEKLVLASNKGSLQMLLRNIIDNKAVDTKGADIVKVLAATKQSQELSKVKFSESKQRKHQVVKLPRIQAVEVIKGVTMTEEKFKYEQ